MKKALLFSIFCILFLSCKKYSNSSTGNQVVTGILMYSGPAGDGAGLYFLTDSTKEFLYFYDDSGDHFNDPDNFKDSLGKHLRFTYLDEGRRGCPFCQVIPAPQERIVKLISLVRE